MLNQKDGATYTYYNINSEFIPLFVAQISNQTDKFDLVVIKCRKSKKSLAWFPVHRKYGRCGVSHPVDRFISS